MAEKKLVNTETDKSVGGFIDAIPNKKRKEDSRVLLKTIQDITGVQPRIWGVSIVGFGKYTYQRKNGDEFEWFNVGFSAGSAHLTLYVMYNLDDEAELLEQLGLHRKGKGCLYIKKLEDIDMAILKKLISKSNRWQRP